MTSDATRSYAELLKEHQTRFTCHVCGAMSVGPYCQDESANPPESASCNWEIPRNLVRCEVCQCWGCETHIKNMGYESWWICIVCFLEESARIAVEAGDRPD